MFHLRKECRPTLDQILEALNNFKNEKKFKVTDLMDNPVTDEVSSKDTRLILVSRQKIEYSLEDEMISKKTTG